jgi:hypothetical protein
VLTLPTLCRMGCWKRRRSLLWPHARRRPSLWSTIRNCRARARRRAFAICNMDWRISTVEFAPRSLLDSRALLGPVKSACGKVSRVRHMVPGGSRESLPERKVRFADLHVVICQVKARVSRARSGERANQQFQDVLDATVCLSASVPRVRSLQQTLPVLGESRLLRYDGPLRKAGCGTDL